MAFTTYSEFAEAVKDITFPEGEAENLATTYDSYIQDALINLQTFVPCLRDNQFNFYQKDDFKEWCGTDFTYVPRGVVHAVYAFKPSKQCKKLFYEAVSTSFMDNLIQQSRCVACPDQEDPDSPLYGPMCNEISDADSYCEDVDDEENDCRFKSSRRYYAIGPNQKLILFPRFPCGYQVAVHWEGVKRSWEDQDPVTDDTELKIAVSKYVQAQVSLFLDRDTPIYDRIMHPKNGDFAISRADMIHRCTRERRIQDRHQALGGMDVLQPFLYDPLPEPEDVFAYIADWGDPGAGLTAVDGLIEGWSPQFIVTGGDNKYGVTMAAAFAAAPYIESIWGDELVYPSIANHDMNDGGGLADFLAAFPYIDYNATRNYSIRKNHVEFFFFETHDTGTAPPDLALQETWLAGALAASDAPFKIVVTQDPPYTSGIGNYPGHSGSQLDYADLGADLVLSGDSHQYERLQMPDGTPIVIGGWSGTDIDVFNGTASPYSIVRYNDNFGAVRGRASHNRLVLEAVNITGEVIDVLTLTK